MSFVKCITVVTSIAEGQLPKDSMLGNGKQRLNLTSAYEINFNKVTPRIFFNVEDKKISFCLHSLP